MPKPPYVFITHPYPSQEGNSGSWHLEALPLLGGVGGGFSEKMLSTEPQKSEWETMP